ncbi:MAG: hypothetical protein DMF80_14820 [Acidobacteria bacterium]|nr:MAG: hypothetical protein DMF80_14820 [Acidobacteriota bacterium]PYQ18700.1 MAG: hypothetical protein DMF81_24145 [Acidobacteriota bacterium]
MDEFAAYHALGCAAFPLSRELNVYRERCADDELILPFVSRPLPLRSYLYLGSLPVAPFYPFWRLLRDPVAARAQGAVFLLVALHLFSRLAAARFEATLLAALVFPLFAGAFLVDTGPVGISLLLLAGTLLLVQAAAGSATARPAGLRAAGAGALAFLGVWVKLNFLWMLPAVLIFWVDCLRRSAPPAGRRAVQAAALGCFAAALLVPSAWLMSARTAGGERYYDVVRLGGMSADPEAIATQARTLTGYLVDGSAVAPRALSFPRSVIDVVPALVSAALLVWGVRRERRAGVWLAGAVATFLVMLPSARAWAAHHLALGLVFVVLALAVALQRLGDVRPALFRGAAAIVAAYWLGLAARWPAAAIDPRDSFGKDRLLAFVRTSGLDRRAVQLHVSWGTYYIAHLFGDRSQAVLFSRRFPEDPAMLSDARAAADARGRSVVLIGRRLDKIQTPAVDQSLGPPRATHDFDGWWLVEYVR